MRFTQLLGSILGLASLGYKEQDACIYRCACFPFHFNLHYSITAKCNNTPSQIAPHVPAFVYKQPPQSMIQGTEYYYLRTIQPHSLLQPVCDLYFPISISVFSFFPSFFLSVEAIIVFSYLSGLCNVVGLVEYQIPNSWLPNVVQVVCTNTGAFAKVPRVLHSAVIAVTDNNPYPRKAASSLPVQCKFSKLFPTYLNCSY